MHSSLHSSLFNKFLTAIILVGLLLPQVSPATPVQAVATLSVTPLTWNVIGLDSNNVNVGPNHFPVGARVCNTSATDTATNVKSSFVFDDGLDLFTGNAYINLRAGTLSAHTADGIILAPGQCTEFFYEVEVTRNSGAYDKTRRYYITASSDSGAVTGSTSRPRELYVEHLVSQSRNAVTNVQLDGVSIPAGGTMSLVVGNTYTIKLIGYTATQGYNQLESFINFPNTIFQIISVASTYTAGTSPTTRLYADACGWDNVITSPTYRSCIVSDNKSGGDVTTTYVVKILHMPEAPMVNPEPLSTLLFDFSGSSYHYNSDYSISQRFSQITDPSASVDITKAFSPSSIPPGGTSTLTFSLVNTASVSVSGVGFTDNLPLSSGNQMVVATPATYSSSGCGAGSTLSFTPVAGASSITVSGATIAPNSSCTINVSVSVPAATPNGTFANTTEHLFVGAVDTGKSASANLTVNTSSGSSGTGLCGLTLANWNYAGLASGAMTSPYAANTNNVTTANMTWGNGLSSEGDTTSGGGNPQPGALTYGWPKTGPVNTATSPYIQFAVNTSQYTAVKLRFDAQRKANGPNNDELYYSTNGTSWTLKSTFTSTTAWTSFPSASTYYDFSGQTSTTGLTYFRIYGYGANATSSGNDFTIDNIGFTGCSTPVPPTVTKTFNTNPVALNGTSTLSFTITNPNSAALSGIQFTDVLPTGLSIADSGPTTVCGGSLTTTASSRTIIFTGGSLAAGASCTITTGAITVSISGPHPNISGFISSTESGTNSTSTGIARDTINAVQPPQIEKGFNPNPIISGAVSTLTFIITNPNPSDALTNVAFTDTFPSTASGAPGNMVTAASPGLTTTGCGSPTVVAPIAGSSVAPAAGSISFSGGTIAAGGTCTVTVNVTAADIGQYSNTTSAVTTTINSVVVGTDTASATFNVKAANPGLVLSKKVSSNSTGPWSSYLTVSPGSTVYYQLTVENIGDVPLDLNAPVIDDPLVDTSGCSWLTTLPVASATDDPTDSCVVSTTALGGDHPNTATATGYYGATPITSTSSADYFGSIAGQLNLSKQVSTSASGPWTTDLTGVTPGADIYYRFTVINLTGVQLSTLALTDLTIDTSGCTLTDPLEAGGSTACIIGPISAETTGTRHTNTATVTGSNGGTPYTSPSSSATYALAAPNLALGKSNHNTTLTAGGTTTYELTITNSGETASTGTITVVDVLPTGLSVTAGAVTLTGANSGEWSCTAAGQVITCTSSVAISAGNDSVFSFMANIDSGATGTLTNKADMGGGGDPDLTTPPTETTAGNCTADGTPTDGCAVDTDTVTSNAVPLAVDDAATATAGVAQDVDVLANDTQLGDTPTAITSTTDPTQGTVTINDNGTPSDPTDDTITYTPSISASGTDSFTYTICDSTTPTADCSTATVVITLNAVPIAVDDSDTATAGVARDVNVLANDTQLGDTPSSIHSVGTPGKGTAIINDNGTPADPTDDKITYTPSITASGTDTFTYTICDDTLPVNDCSTATVTITLNAVPVAVDDSDSATAGTGVYVDVLANDTQLGDTPTSITTIPTPPGQGTAVIDTNGTPSDPTDDTILYTPSPTASGSDSFTYTICDATTPTPDCSTATVTISLSAVPVAEDDTDTATAGISTEIDVLANDTQLGDTPTEITLVSTPGQGTATINNHGTPADPTDDTITYTPNADASGTDTFTYTICDSSTPADCSTATVTITLNALPTAVDDTPANLAGNSTNNIITVLGNDNFGGDGPSASAITITVSPSNGTATVDDGGTPTDPTDDTILYTPNTGYTGTDSLTYQICDSNGDCDTADVAIHIVANPGAISGVVFTDLDADGIQDPGEDPIAGVTIECLDSIGGSVGTRVTDTNGAYSFENLEAGNYTVNETDPGGYISTTSNSVSVTVTMGATSTVNFGDMEIPDASTASISGVVFDDVNGNGDQDSGETTLEGVTITLLDNLGNTVATTTTSVSGAYSFLYLDAGSYTVVETDLPAYVSTTLNSVSVVISSGAEATINFGDQESGGVAIIDPAVTKLGDPNEAEVGDIITYTITVGNNGNVDATDVVLTDTKPDFLDIVSVNITPSGSFPTTISGTTVRIEFGTVTPTDFYTVVILTRVNDLGRAPGGTNQVELTATSEDARAANNLADFYLTVQDPTDDTDIEADKLPGSGFAPSEITLLSSQPSTVVYEEYGDLWLEIPALNVKTSIVGIPFSDGTWNVTWLGDQAGWMNGTAFPSWEGNSALTAHVYLADGTPGPFINLADLKWGDRVIIHLYGQEYIYEVRQSELAKPTDTSWLDHKAEPWLTLITCKDYDEKTKAYRWRVVVQAVLIDVKEE